MEHQIIRYLKTVSKMRTAQNQLSNAGTAGSEDLASKVNQLEVEVDEQTAALLTYNPETLNLFERAGLLSYLEDFKVHLEPPNKAKIEDLITDIKKPLEDFRRRKEQPSC